MSTSFIAALTAALLVTGACAAPVARNPEPVITAPVGAAPERLREDAIRLAQLSDTARRAALLALLRERGVAVDIQHFEARARRDSALHRGQNLVATLGSGPREIILGAHYDAERHAGILVPGMIDNAAATVILARIAQTLRNHPLRHTVRVVWFDLEELGLLGSQRYASAVDRSRVAAMVNLDVTGYGDAIIYGPAARPGNERVYRAMRRTCAENAYSCIEFPEYPPSDDRSFQEVGVPNISIATLPRVEAHQLWLLMNGGKNSGLRAGFVPDVGQIIHTAEDTPARLDETTMRLAYGAVLALVLRLDAELPTPP